MDKKNKVTTNYYVFIIISLISLLFIFKVFLIPLTLALVFSVVCSEILPKIPIQSIKIKSFLVSSLIVALFVLPAFFLISLGANESLSFLKNFSLTQYANSDLLYNNKLLNPILKLLSIPQSEFTMLFDQTLIDIKKVVIVNIQQLIYGIPEMFFNFSVMVSAIYFMLVDGKKISNLFYQNFLYDRNVGDIIVKSFSSTAWAILLATLGSAIIQTIIVIIPTLFCNFNNVLLISFSIFIFSMVPIIGTVPVIAALFFYHMSLNQYEIAFMYVAIGFIIGFVDSILKAVILQKRVKINPFIALLSSFAGVHAFGIFGLILGPIIIITLLNLLLYTLKIKKI